LAALYLETQLRAAGADPVNGKSYRQYYNVGDFIPADSKLEISIGGRPLSPSDYVFWNISGDPAESPITLPLTYAGFGVTAPERNMDQLDGLTLDGQAVVVRKGAPWDLDSASVWPGPRPGEGRSHDRTRRARARLSQ